MKIGRYLDASKHEKVGMILGDRGAYRVLDLASAANAKGLHNFAQSMDQFIDAGASALAQAYELSAWAEKQADPAWFQDEKTVAWLPPVAVKTCFAAGRNFGKHKAETADYWKKQASGFHNEIPMGFIKLARTIVPTGAEVACPPESTWFDYEVEPVAVIGSAALRVSEADALKSVFGYTVFNDLSARDIQRKEMANQSILIGKNLPGFGPLGPWILTADEVPDPTALELKLRVNGEARQHGFCSDMINSFAQLISSWSSMGLARGDVIAGGTPEGVAIGKPEPKDFFLKRGDVVEAEISQIGILETRIV